MRKAFEQFKKFASRVDEADRFDERHLLPIATEIFGTNSFPLHTEYIALPKRRNSRILVTARRMAFASYYSFVLTDFFEGLHHGHYPRQCEVCKQYFLMQSARRQKYCTYWVEEMKASGFNMIPCIQGAKTLSLPMQNMGADLQAKRIVYNNHPILKWCLTNTGVKTDVNGNIVPVKNQAAKQRIDGMASLLDAYVGLTEKYEEYIRTL